MAGPPDRTTLAPDPREAISRVNWYHSIEVADGVVTPGAFDLRPIVDRLPWPEVRGRRCLDVGTYDGFFAFELERRGAAEVVAVDIPGHEHWDWEVGQRARGIEFMRAVMGPELGAGARLARELLGSTVTFERMSVYELSEAALGRFDVVVCGSLLLHLRDPLRALEAIRGVCAEALLCTNYVDPWLTLLHPRRATFRLDGTGGQTQWWLPNRAGHRQLLRAAGFEIVRESGVYAEPFGAGHRPGRRGAALLRRLAGAVAAGRNGVPHHAILASPTPVSPPGG